MQFDTEVFQMEAAIGSSPFVQNKAIDENIKVNNNLDTIFLLWTKTWLKKLGPSGMIIKFLKITLNVSRLVF